MALPMLDAMAPALSKTPDRPIRLSFIETPNGVWMDKFTPATEGAFELPNALEPLKDVGDLPRTVDFVKGPLEKQVLELYFTQKTVARPMLAPPEADEVEIRIDEEKELRIEVKRSSGPGGQSVNTTDSAVRTVGSSPGSRPTAVVRASVWYEPSPNTSTPRHVSEPRCSPSGNPHKDCSWQITRRCKATAATSPPFPAGLR